ncbi:MAG: type III polyketide synthase [Caldilinea sp. CFX5]|nr:type III polyketide synthase [Caldilinea sp. CFX5]
MTFMGYHPVHALAPSGQNAQQPAVAILAFGTALPPYGVAQAEIGEWMAQSLGKKSATSRLLHSLHANSGIDWRHSCSPDYLLPPTESRFAPGQPLTNAPTTAERMAIYTKEAPPLGTAAAQQALIAYAEKRATTVADVRDSITHLVVVSCTGFFAPGLDFVIARDLALTPTVQRTLIGFMGCSAAFNGLRAAHQIVRSEPNARVLVVSVELCSLHTQPNPGRQQLAAYALFADGAAACLVGQPTADETAFFQLDAFHTSTKPDTQTDMVWAIGDHGFTLRLSPQIPQHLADLAPTALQTLFADERPDFWAIHPGGRAIVDRLAQIFALADADVAASREILRRYGNLSSATILFVLAELGCMLQQQRATEQATSGVAMAFGPGLVIELARLTYQPVAQPSLPSPLPSPLALMTTQTPISNGKESSDG